MKPLQPAGARPDQGVWTLGPGRQTTLFEPLPVLDGRLYLASGEVKPEAQTGTVVVSLHKKLRYLPFCDDFGPISIGATIHMARKLEILMLEPHLSKCKIIFCSATVTMFAYIKLTC